MCESLALGAATTAALIVAAHFFCWHRRLSLLWRYIIGTACIGAGIAITAWRLQQPLIALAFGATASTAGLATLLLHSWRKSRGEQSGEVAGYIRAGRVIERADDGSR